VGHHAQSALGATLTRLLGMQTVMDVLVESTGIRPGERIGQSARVVQPEDTAMIQAKRSAPNARRTTTRTPRVNYPAYHALVMHTIPPLAPLQAVHLAAATSQTVLRASTK
jgi:hypothetical protein